MLLLVQDIPLKLPDSKPSPAAPKPTSKPVVAKSSSASKPSFVPKSTGKPVAPAKPKPKNITKDAGWGDAEDVEKETLTRNLWITFHRHINQQRLTLTN